MISNAYFIVENPQKEQMDKIRSYIEGTSKWSDNKSPLFELTEETDKVTIKYIGPMENPKEFRREWLFKGLAKILFEITGDTGK